MDSSNNILSGDINSLKEYRSFVENYENSKTLKEQSAQEEKRLEKDLTLNKKNLKDNIDATVRKRRLEVADKFDEEIEKDRDKIKKIKSKREKAKEKGVKGRIEEETSELTTQNNELKRNIKNTLKEDKLPKICYSNIYYTLYFTKGVGEGFICALMIILMFLILPAAVYLALPMEKLPKKFEIPGFALTYFVVIVIAFFVYKLIGDKTKHRHKETLTSVRSIKDQIYSNKRQIKKIAKSIQKDKNEEMYGLGDFDNSIKEVEDDIASINQKKEEALSNFDVNVQPEIVAEIENRELPRINEIEFNYNEVVKKHAELEDTVKQMGLKLSTDYEAYLGKNFSDLARIDELITIMETGKAVTVSDAVNAFRTKE